MTWFSMRNNLIAIGTISAFLLLLGNRVGINPSSEIFNTGITLFHLIGIGLVYQVIALWKRYI